MADHAATLVSARELWAQTTVRVWPGRYRLVRLPLDLAVEAASVAARGAGECFAALVCDRDEATLAVAESIWEVSPLQESASRDEGPFAVLTFDIALPLEVTGFLAPAAERLARAEVPIVPQCGFSRDHVMVPYERLGRAVAAVEALIAECRSELPPPPASSLLPARAGRER